MLKSRLAPLCIASVESRHTVFLCRFSDRITHLSKEHHGTDLQDSQRS